MTVEKSVFVGGLLLLNKSIQKRFSVSIDNVQVRVMLLSVELSLMSNLHISTIRLLIWRVSFHSIQNTLNPLRVTTNSIIIFLMRNSISNIESLFV